MQSSAAYGPLYREIRTNVIDLLTDRPDAADRPVPACPGWRIHDLIGHLTAICTVAARRLAEGVVPEQPEMEKADHPALDLPELLERWRHDGDRLDRLIEEQGGVTPILIVDAFCHELDLRRALELPPPEGHPAYALMVPVVSGAFNRQVIERGLPPVRLEAGDWSRNVGEGEPVATLRAHPHDMYRTLTGRRAPEQITGLAWEGADPGTWLPAFTWGPFTPPPRPVEDMVEPPRPRPATR